MYLSRHVQSDRTFRMTGILPADTEMTKKIQALGYVRGSISRTTPLFSHDLPFAGHEFHYSKLVPDPDVRYSMKLSRGMGIDSGNDGICEGSALGCYTHAYFTRALAEEFVNSAARYSRT